MTVARTRWLGRLTAVALLIVLLGLIFASIAAPVLDSYAKTRAEIRHTGELLERYRTIAAARGDLERRLSALRAQQQDSGVFLGGATEALVAAQLQERITTAVADAGGRVRSVRTLAPEPLDGLTRVAMRLQLMADIRAIGAFLYTLETGRPLLVIDDLDIRGRLQRVRDPSVPIEISPDLLVDIEVAGYRLEDPN